MYANKRENKNQVIENAKGS